MAMNSLALVIAVISTIGSHFMSPRVEGIGNTLVPVEIGASSVFNMPTGVALGKGITLTSTYQIPYSMTDLFRAFLAVAMKTPLVDMGFGVHVKKSGQFYQEYQFALVEARKINRYFILALRQRLLRVSVRESSNVVHTGNKALLDWAFTLDLGMLKVSAYQDNMLRPRIKVYQANERILSSSGVSLLMNIPANTIWVASIERRNGETVPHIGVESWYTTGFAVRMGIDNTQFTIGMGIKAGNFGVDFSAKTHRYLGTTYSTGVYIGFPVE